LKQKEQGTTLAQTNQVGPSRYDELAKLVRYSVAELVDKYRRGQAMYIFLCLTNLLPKLSDFIESTQVEEGPWPPLA
jgi:hypothetical protein